MVKGRDYTDKSSPTVRMESVRMGLSIATELDGVVEAYDVTQAFTGVYVAEAERCYSNVPEGCPKFDEDGDELVAESMNLYGGVSAGRKWFFRHKDDIISGGFKQSKHDPCVFIKWVGEEFCFLYVIC